MVKMRQAVPSDVAQRIIVKLITNENVKPTEILMRLRAQFSDETLSRTQVYDCHLKKTEHWLKTCEYHTLCRESYSQRFWDSHGAFFIDFLIEQRNHQRSLLFEAS
jgi:hypothetical protein